MIQGTDEWHKARLGKITASRLIDVMSKTKSGYSARRKNYMLELVCQKLSGATSDCFVSEAMQRGIELESSARSVYEAKNGLFVDEVGFLDHGSISGFGASPDGLVESDGLIEIKCPNTATHLDFIRSQKPKKDYILQMHGQMMCAGRKWCDFVSFDDRLPGLEFASVRVEFDQNLADEIASEVQKFNEEMEKLIKEINKLKEM